MVSVKVFYFSSSSVSFNHHLSYTLMSGGCWWMFQELRWQIPFYLRFYLCACFACTYIHAPCECPVPMEIRRGHQITWNWSYKKLGFGPKSFGKAASILNLWTIFEPIQILFLIRVSGINSSELYVYFHFKVSTHLSFLANKTIPMSSSLSTFTEPNMSTLLSARNSQTTLWLPRVLWISLSSVG